MASILNGVTRSSDVSARIGGDEFVLVVATTNAARIAEIRTSIETSVAALRPLGDDAIRIGASVGAALLESGVSLGAALNAADAQAYLTKLEHQRKA